MNNITPQHNTAVVQIKSYKRTFGLLTGFKLSSLTFMSFIVLKK